MPETAKILAFRARRSSAIRSRDEASARATAYLEVPTDERRAQADDVFSDCDVLSALLAHLWNLANTAPATVADETSRIYSWVSSQDEKRFFFDERAYFLGESALLAAGSHRLLGKREETERWLDRADANFRHTVAPAAHLARVSYSRLTLRYDTHRHDDLLELIPSVALTFKKFRMLNDYAKCEFLRAMSLKELGRLNEAADVFEGLTRNAQDAIDSALAGMAFVNLGGLRSEQGMFADATAAYAQAVPLLQKARRYSALADLKAMLGTTLQKTGQLAAAIDTFRESVNDYVGLGMETRAAYVRLFVAGALLEAQRPREAEWEILAALPIFDEQKMGPEAMAALGILRESARLRKTDSKALRDLREHLQAVN